MCCPSTKFSVMSDTHLSCPSCDAKPRGEPGPPKKGGTRSTTPTGVTRVVVLPTSATFPLMNETTTTFLHDDCFAWLAFVPLHEVVNRDPVTWPRPLPWQRLSGLFWTSSRALSGRHQRVAHRHVFTNRAGVFAELPVPALVGHRLLPRAPRAAPRPEAAEPPHRPTRLHQTRRLRPRQSVRRPRQNLHTRGVSLKEGTNVYNFYQTR